MLHCRRGKVWRHLNDNKKAHTRLLGYRLGDKGGSDAHGHNMLLVGPMGQIKEGARLAAEGAPVDATKTAEVGQAEGEGTAVEEDGAAGLVYLPESTAIGAIFVPIQEVSVLIDAAELQDAVLVDDEFLIHGLTINCGYKCARSAVVAKFAEVDALPGAEVEAPAGDGNGEADAEE